MRFIANSSRIQPSHMLPTALRLRKDAMRFGTVAAIALVAGLGLTSCGSENERKESNTFYFNIADQMQSLDPVQITQQSNWWVGEMIHAGLIGLDKGMHPIPKIADRWEVSEDGLSWTFHIRENARFADDPCFPDGKGRKITADDVRYSFERLCDPSVSRGFWVFEGKVRGASDYFEAMKNGGADAPEHVPGFVVVDDSTFRIELDRPFPPFMYMLTMPLCYIVPREAVETYGKDFSLKPVGAGPFHLVEWKPNQEMVLANNRNYFEQDDQGTQLPYLDSVWISFIADPTTVFTDFKRGSLDLVVTIEPVYATNVLNEDGRSLTPEFSEYGLHASPSMSIDYYGFTLDTTLPGGKTSPFSRNRYLRQAINYGIDREKIVRYVLKGLAEPAVHGPIPPSTPGYTGVGGYTYDPEKARALLDSAGYPNGEGLEPFTLQIGNNQKSASVAEAVQEDLKKLGLEMEIKQVDFSTHLNTADEGKIPFWRTSWLADYPHAENFMANFYSPYFKPSGPNRSRYSNPTVDSLYRAALQPGLSDEEWSSIYGRAERIVLDDAPWVFIYYSAIRQLTQPWISGYEVDPLQRIDLLHVRKMHEGTTS